MRSPRFSVIIPTLNEEKFLPRLLDSLKKQSHKNFEVIVVDGSSKDKTVKVARSFARKLPKLQIIVSKKASLPLQRNVGAKEAKGKWLVFVDADSILMPYFMSRITHFIARTNPEVFTTWFTADSEITKDALFTLVVNLTVENVFALKRPYPIGPLACIRQDVFHRVGGYDQTRAYYEDVDLGLRLSNVGIRFSILRETLFVWSLRRFRREGTLRVIQQYIVSSLLVLLFRQAPKSMPGYIMGGHLYGKREPIKMSIVKTYERKLKKLMKEFFE